MWHAALAITLVSIVFAVSDVALDANRGKRAVLGPAVLVFTVCWALVCAHYSGALHWLVSAPSACGG